MPKKVVNIFSVEENFPVPMLFEGQEIEFTLRKLPGGTKYKVLNECITIRSDGATEIDFGAYAIKMLSLMIVDNPTTGGILTEEQVFNLRPEILEQLEVFLPKVGSVDNPKIQELLKKA